MFCDMIIKDIFAPKVTGEHTAEEVIFRRGVGELLVELRDVLMRTKLLITDTPRKKAETPIPGVPSALNLALAVSLTSLGWTKRQAPGSTSANANLDWHKMRPSGLSYMGDVGIAVEVQFGNNFQFNADVQRFAEAILQGKIIAGVSIVPSDKFARYKADRGASFSDAKSKLERLLSIWSGSGAILIPSIMIWGIEPDGFMQSEKPGFAIEYPVFDLAATKNEMKPIRTESFDHEKARALLTSYGLDAASVETEPDSSS